MLTCTAVTELSSRELELPLGLREQLALRTHLMMCSGCANYRRQLKTLRQVMQVYAQGGAVNTDPDPDGTR
jgi:predicted anti-sigma-YlaC factor YlaD